MKNKKLKIERSKVIRMEKAERDLKKIQEEIAPFIKKQKRIEDSKGMEWQKTSTFLLSY